MEDTTDAAIDQLVRNNTNGEFDDLIAQALAGEVTLHLLTISPDTIRFLQRTIEALERSKHGASPAIAEAIEERLTILRADLAKAEAINADATVAVCPKKAA